MPSPEPRITLTATSPARRTGEPVTLGVPFPIGQVTNATSLRLIGPEGDVPLQVRVLDRWGDGSARWVLCDWQVNIDGAAEYRLRLGDSTNQSQTNMPVGPQSEEFVSNLVVKLGAKLFSSDPLHVTDNSGQAHDPLPDFDWYVEDAGPLRVCIREGGTITRAGVHLARYTLRTHYFANSPVVRVHFTITNPNRAGHPGGCWDLGDAGSILLSDVSWSFELPGDGPAIGRYSPEVDRPFEPFARELELYQDSSGGANWQSTNHLNLDRKVTCQFRGYRMRSGSETMGLRATPIVTLRRGADELSVAMPDFWQNFPKAIEANDRSITLRLFPKQAAELHELQGGEQKTHVFHVAQGQDRIADAPLTWTRRPIQATIDPAWVAATGAIPYLAPRSADPNPDYARLTEAAIEGPDTFDAKREVIDEYGWRHFGDLYGDHEAILHAEVGPRPRASHYNNQYDCVDGFATQWLRTGDACWFRPMRELVRHVIDIDLYHTDEDKAAYNHGLFWHTYHYVDADTGTHRSYPKAGRVPPKYRPVLGGGPGNEQNYAHGLMLDYFLTGDEGSRLAALGLAQWVVDMDDGRRTVFRWLCTGDTGLASASRSPDYHGPGRGAANSISALIDGHRLTGDAKFLQKAEQLIRRVIHPTDDVTRRVGFVREGKVFVDAENRWFYVMFLQALAKYLDHKAELQQLDANYAYARASLLHYARWMAEHEYPYLDRPTELEYPTETWAAQDLRKSEVFDFAAMHVEGADRLRFRERAEFFHRNAIETLAALPTRTLCRPLVLLMTQGWRRTWFAANPEATRPAPMIAISDFGRPTEFVPQKVIAIRRAKKLLVVVGLIFILAIAAVGGWLAMR